MILYLLIYLLFISLAESQEIYQFNYKQSTIKILNSGNFEKLKKDDFIRWFRKSSNSVTKYTGTFPVKTLLVNLKSSNGYGVKSGTTYNGRKPYILLRIGKMSDYDQIKNDWTIIHEMIHLCFPDMKGKHRWIEEGLATYLVPFIRYSASMINEEQLWMEFYKNLPKGQARSYDKGLDNTDNWRSRYWGGALFCFVLDYRLRLESKNKYGLHSVIRFLIKKGYNIEVSLPLKTLFDILDKEFKVKLFSEMYDEAKSEPKIYPLDKIWSDLGIKVNAGKVHYNKNARSYLLKENMLKIK